MNPDEPLLQIRGLFKRYGSTVALDGIDLKVGTGSVHCIIGPSGCGKSTLLRCINWLETPDYGEIELDRAIVGKQATPNCKLTGREIRQLNQTRARIGMVFQNFNLWPHLSALENVTRAQTVVLKREKGSAQTKAIALLKLVGLGDKLSSMPHQLSGGQAQRVAIARALAMDPTLMLFDEPTSALDPELVGEVLGVLLKLAKGGMTMLIVTHELGFARRVADQLIFMDHGKIVEQGDPTTLMSNPHSERLQAFLEKLAT